MNILHTLWQPGHKADFIQSGELCLWVESGVRAPSKKTARQGPKNHPGALDADSLQTFLERDLNFDPTRKALTSVTCSLMLPDDGAAPLPCPELLRESGEMPTEAVGLSAWRVAGYALASPIAQLNELHFLSAFQAGETQAGSDFMFWYWYTQNFKRIILKDHYIPYLVYRREVAGKSKKTGNAGVLYAGWRPLGESYQALLSQALEVMPPVCAAVDGGYQPESLLRHFSENLLERLIQQARLPVSFQKKVEYSLVEGAIRPLDKQPWRKGEVEEEYRQWRQWRQRLSAGQENVGFYLGFRLLEATPENMDDWAVEFLIIARHDLSLQIPLADYWTMRPGEKKKLQQQLDEQLDKHLLVGLGQAARMYPPLWRGLENAQPTGIALNLDDAFEFLREYAWILEDAGYKVLVPTWWTPQGRRKAKIRLRGRAAGQSAASGSGSAGSGLLSLDKLVRYEYRLAIGDQEISEDEWQQLVQAKKPLVFFRGQWMELDRDKMKEMLEFWQNHGGELPEMSLPELIRKTSEESELFELDQEDALAEMLAGLRDNARLRPAEAPPGLRAELRDYQKRGLAWLNYLDHLGLHGCLADDMGLGKTMQVIARLMTEQAGQAAPRSNLLVAPTSVLGNWRKEVERFAPMLQTLIHHGPAREKNAKAFKQQAEQQHLVLTSYTLARKDEKLFNGVQWNRIILDEAQNIKNPKAAQTKAIFKLKADHRLALTGTPVENRLMDLWSIFNFLNPGYLGTQAHFRKTFELPVQRDNDPVKSTTLKRLVEPFILRRVKTDKAIIKDLPDKVEARQYCNLSKEQASLYEAVVREVEEKLDSLEGVERQGLMLSTLMRLKQICNHPSQFLQDNSAFAPERSHKLERLGDMLEEVVADGDSSLIFTQFTEIGDNLVQHLRQGLHCPVHYLHGGTSREKREKMINDFQNPESPPSLFVLSLKAGGVGITLTKANHVFHFDRWWNPAVEDQATDRAFRIGQEKNVFVHKFVTLGTLEERIDQMIEDKKSIAGAIVGNDESWLSRLDNEHFKQLIALNRDMVVEG